MFSNLTPRRRNHWKTPHEAWHQYANWIKKQSIYITKPDLSFLKVYGCKAFVLNPLGKAIAEHQAHPNKMGESSKFAPRAHIGYLVGYGPTLWQRPSTNIFRIWVPQVAGSFTIPSRDVTFNEKEFYNPQDVPQLPAHEAHMISMDLQRKDLHPEWETFEEEVIEGRYNNVLNLYEEGEGEALQIGDQVSQPANSHTRTEGQTTSIDDNALNQLPLDTTVPPEEAHRQISTLWEPPTPTETDRSADRGLSQSTLTSFGLAVVLQVTTSLVFLVQAQDQIRENLANLAP